MSTSKIKWYSSFNTNAPKLDNNWGALLNVFQKCLVDGYGQVQIASFNFNQNVVTVTTSSPHGFLQFQTVLIEGTGATELDKEHHVFNVMTETQFQIELKNTSLQSLAANSATVKLPSLGWEIVFSDTGRAIFKSKAEEGPNHCLFVQDKLLTGYTTSWAKFASTALAEDFDGTFNFRGRSDLANIADMGGLGSGTSMRLPSGKIYYATAGSNGVSNTTITPSSGSTNGNQTWYLIGDGSTFYIVNSIHPSSTNFQYSGFGQYNCYHQGFRYNSFIANFLWNDQAANNGANFSMDTAGLTSTYKSVKTLGIYGKSTTGILYLNSYNGISYSGNSNLLSSSGPINLFEVYLRDSNSVLMGTLKNLYWLAVATPYRNQQIFQQGNSVFIALNTYANNYLCQVVLKLAELE